MRCIYGAVLALVMILSMPPIAFAKTGSVEVNGHIEGAVYHITYYANGGRGSCEGPNVTTGDTDMVYALDKTGITRSGYEFTDWNTRQDGCGISYKAGDSIILNGNVTLYAQWKEKTDRYSSTGRDGRVRPSGGDTATSKLNPGTGDENGVLICAGLSFISFAVVMLILREVRRKTRRGV